MTQMNPRSVLVVDDEPGMRAGLAANFQRDGWSVETASGVNEAIRRITGKNFAAVVTDVRMPDGDGLQLMRRLRKESPETAVIVLTAFGSVPEAVNAMHDGACHYFTKPVAFETLRQHLETVNALRPAKAAATSEGAEMVGNSPALQRCLERARHAARTDADVLVEAESGTGKELLARYIHNLSDRRGKPFVALNCSAVPEHLLESELFGHLRGAFTGATQNRVGKFIAADGGTLLLDEIGEMPLTLQPKLLRVLQERVVEPLGHSARPIPVNIRVIATTNVSLLELVGQGRFRADLFYRLNVIPISLPPLRLRQDDIPVLAQHFTTRFAAEARKPEPELSAEFLAGLMRQEWPGNVRELSNFIRRVVVLSETPLIDTSWLAADSLHVQTVPVPSAAPLAAGASLRDMERQLLEKTLEATQGNRTRAAEMLGVSLRTIRNRIREYGLPPRSFALR